jgi:fumarate hydratase class II
MVLSKKTRIESDSMGKVDVPIDAYWGAQTQRSIKYFSIGSEKPPRAFVRALGIVKLCAAQTNASLKRLPVDVVDAIILSSHEVICGALDDHFPLSIWQTGSGTQSNMNANEVISNRAIEILGGELGSNTPVHPNDHVNLGQSSNDTIPTAMHIAVVEQLHMRLIPAIESLRAEVAAKSLEWMGIIKIGRTHLQDATPLSLGQEFSAYEYQLALGLERIEACLPRLLSLAQGGTAVGTGLNTAPNFSIIFAEKVSIFTKLGFVSSPNKFESLASHDAMVECHGVLNTLAVSLNKIANDIRLLASGPRCGIGELSLPENEPGSSIMPGKVNPTQCEALSMVCAQVMGNQTTVTIAGAQGHLQLNTFKPVIMYNLLQSIQLLADSVNSFNKYCVVGIKPNLKKIDYLLNQSLMLVTALTPIIGYDKAAEIVKKAHNEGSTLRQAAISSGYFSASEFDAAVLPSSMIDPQSGKSA